MEKIISALAILAVTALTAIGIEWRVVTADNIWMPIGTIAALGGATVWEAFKTKR